MLCEFRLRKSTSSVRCATATATTTSVIDITTTTTFIPRRPCAKLAFKLMAKPACYILPNVI